MQQRYADERKRLVDRTTFRAVQEATVPPHVADDFRTARLRHQARDSLADVIAPKGALLCVQLAGGGNDPELIALQEGERPTQHAHAALEDHYHLLEELADIAPARNHGGDFAQHGYLGCQSTQIVHCVHSISNRSFACHQANCMPRAPLTSDLFKSIQIHYTIRNRLQKALHSV